MKKKETEPTTQITARFPDSIYAQVAAIAEKDHRSLANAAILLVREALEHRAKRDDA